MIDVDHFKDINTEHLYAGGDAALIGLARVLTGSMREVVDSLGRLGGEEFLVIARETDEDGANILAERIRTTVEGTPIEYQGKQIKLTVSVGFAVAEAGVPATYIELYTAACLAPWLCQETRAAIVPSSVRCSRPVATVS